MKKAPVETGAYILALFVNSVNEIHSIYRLPENCKSGERGIRTDYDNLNQYKNLEDEQNQNAAESGAPQINNEVIPDDIKQLIQVWPELPENIKQAVQLMIQPYEDMPQD